MFYQHNTPAPSKKLAGFAFANISIIWGSTFLAMTYGLSGFPPFILSGLRFVIAGLILFLWQLNKGEPFPSLTNWKKNAVTGILILTGGTGLVAWGEQYVSATEAAIAIATGPFWFILIDKGNWKKHFGDWRIIAGLIIGFVGLILFLRGSLGTQQQDTNEGIRGTAFIVLALSSVSWVLGSLYAKRYPAVNSTVMNTAQQLLVAGVAALLIASVKNEWQGFGFENVPVNAWLGLSFLVLMGSIVAYLSYIWLLQVRSPALVSTHIYINPVVAVFAGWVFTRQIISAGQFIGLAVIIAGVVLTNSGKYKPGVRTKVRIRKGFRTGIRILLSPNLLLRKSN
jgi:drug/metabolite transporter (DMT)-like permease